VIIKLTILVVIKKHGRELSYIVSFIPNIINLANSFKVHNYYFSYNIVHGLGLLKDRKG